MFCPRCNKSVTPFAGRCPDCQRSFTVTPVVPRPPGAGAIGSGWQSPESAAPASHGLGSGWAPPESTGPPPMPRPHFPALDEDEGLPPLSLDQQQTVPVDMGTPWEEPARHSRAARAMMGALVLTVGGFLAFVMWPRPSTSDPVAVAPSPVASGEAPLASPSDSPGDESLRRAERLLSEKKYEAAVRYYEQAEGYFRQAGGSESLRARILEGRNKARLALADERIAEGHKALGGKDYNLAIRCAEEALALNRAASGPAARGKKARALVDTANARMAQSHAVTTVAAGPKPVEATATPDVPSLGEGSNVPTGRRSARVAARPAAVEPSQSEPSRPKPPTPPAVRRPPPPPSEPSRLGERNVLPGYNSGSIFR